MSAPSNTSAPYKTGPNLPVSNGHAESDPRVVTVPAARSAPSGSHGTSAARRAALTARSARSREAVQNPSCPVCGTRTLQNMPERTRYVFWCARCQRYPFGSGFGPDHVERSCNEGQG